MFGVNGAEAVFLILLAALVIGPERLPRYAEQLARWVRSARRSLSGTREQLAAEVGWTTLDPRRYDPRWIVREALTTPEPAPRATGGPVPFDDEAT